MDTPRFGMLALSPVRWLAHAPTRRLALGLLSGALLLASLQAPSATSVLAATLPAIDPASDPTFPAPMTPTLITARTTDGMALGNFTAASDLSFSQTSDPTLLKIPAPGPACSVKLKRAPGPPSDALLQWHGDFLQGRADLPATDVDLTYYAPATVPRATAHLVNAWPVDIQLNPMDPAMDQSYSVTFACERAQVSVETTTTVTGLASSYNVGDKIEMYAFLTPQVIVSSAQTFSGHVKFLGPDLPGCETPAFQQQLYTMVARCTTSKVAAGTYWMGATYVAGTTSMLQSSRSSPSRVTVYKGLSSTTVTCSPNPAVYPGTTTCTATVTGGGPTPTGVVSWSMPYDGSFSAASCTLSSGTCSGTYTIGSADASLGQVVLSAQYAGDTNYKPSKGKTTLQVSS